MKHDWKNVWIVMLSALLIFSIVINILQDCQVDELAEEVDSLQYIQKALSDHIDDLEAEDSLMVDKPNYMVDY